MDTGEGRFEMLHNLEELEKKREKYSESKGVFTVGEELEIRGSRFLVKDISPFGIKLKLLKQE
jgi:putative aminopeptidase FrvX